MKYDTQYIYYYTFSINERILCCCRICNCKSAGFTARNKNSVRQSVCTTGKKYLSHLDAYLAATQLGITLASLGLGWIGEPVVSVLIENLLHRIGIEIKPETAHDIALPVAFAIITILHIVFGELAPKSLAIQRSERTTLIIAYPLRLFYIIFKPFIWILNGIAI